MKIILMCSVAVFALVAPNPAGAAETTSDEILARLNAIEKQNAALQAEVAALRKLAKLRPSADRQATDSLPSKRSTAAASFARADDLPVVKARADSSAQAWSWTGFYIGGHVGYGWARTQGSSDVNAPDLVGLPFFQTSIDQQLSGGLAGGQIGLNHQIGRTVLGAELSGTWTGANVASNCFDESAKKIVSTFSPGTFNCTMKQKWSAQLLGRFGYALGGDGRFLPYVLGGVAWTELSPTMQVSGQFFGPVSFGPWGAPRIHQGSVVGAGAQYAVLPQLSIGMEYLLAVYDTQDHGSSAKINQSCGSICISDRYFPTPLSLTTHTARLVMNYKFD